MEEAAAGASFVLRSGVRAGLKREFAFAISQAALERSSRTRRSARTILDTPKPPRQQQQEQLELEKDQQQQEEEEQGQEQQEEDQEQQPAGLVLALVATAPPPPTTMDADADLARHAHNMETMDSSPRRITRSMLQRPPPPLDNSKEASESQVPRRFTRSLVLKDNKADHSNNDDDLSGTTTASNSSPSPSTTSISKGTSILHTNKIPTNLKELLATGLLEGQPVKYIMRKGKRAVLRGVVKRIGILCSCSSCKGRKVVSPYYFEVHAGSTKKHPSDYIFLENGNNLHDILRVCTNATSDMLESAIQKAIGPAPQMKMFKCQTCKSSFSTLRRGKFALLCDSCLESKGSRSSTRPSKIGRSPTSSAKRCKSASPGAKTVSAGRLTRKDKGLHKVVFMSGVLPEGTEVGYYVGGKRLLDGYIKELGIFCHCCNTVLPQHIHVEWCFTA